MASSSFSLPTTFLTHVAIPALSLACCVGLVWVGASGAFAQPSEIQLNSNPAPKAKSVLPANPSDGSTVRPGADPVLPGMPEAIASLIHRGEFTEAIKKLEELRKSPADRPASVNESAIEWQIEKLRRYQMDYSVSREELINKLKKQMRDFKETELDGWMADGLVDFMKIDAKICFVGAAPANLFYLSPELRSRRIGKTDDPEIAQFVYRDIAKMKGLARTLGKNMVGPRRFRVKTTLNTTDPTEKSRAGQTLRCWLPIVREYPFISNIILLESSPKAIEIAPGDALQRTVYLEQTAKADVETTFGIVYEFTAAARVNELSPGKVELLNPNHPIRREWAKEDPPHIRFTPEMRAMYKEIVGEERNPVRIARKIYDWISENIRYSYAREYSTLDDLGLYCGARRAGDCGQEALLFITLCRMGGIPARWQSCWTCYPVWKGMHDWAEIYLEPYGWVPVDPYMGIFAMQYADPLNLEQRKDIRDFYFGSMDAYRLPANASHKVPFQPAKKGFRSDDVDNQRGELEWADGTNLYYGAVDSSTVVKDITSETPSPIPGGKKLSETKYR